MKNQEIVIRGPLFLSAPSCPGDYNKQKIKHTNMGMRKRRQDGGFINFVQMYISEKFPCSKQNPEPIVVFSRERCINYMSDILQNVIGLISRGRQEFVQAINVK